MIRYSTGGNAALMANRFAKEGSEVLLGGTVGTRLGGLLHDRVTTVAGHDKAEKRTQDEDPAAEIGRDEVHLILEYRQGEAFARRGSGSKPIVTPRANRFIVVRDETNARVAGLEPMSGLLASKQAFGGDAPDIFVASGVNQLEGLDGEERATRLAAIGEFLRGIGGTFPAASGSTASTAFPIHLELASIADAAFMTRVATELLPAVDSIGLNEQELASLYEATGGQYAAKPQLRAVTKDELVRKVPAVHAVANAISHVMRFASEARAPDDTASHGPVARVHFHSLAFHLIAESSTVPLHHKWKEAGKTSGAVRAAAKGSATATLQACDVRKAIELGDDDMDLLAPSAFVVFDVSNGKGAPEQATGTLVRPSTEDPVPGWRDETASFFFAPVRGTCFALSRTGFH